MNVLVVVATIGAGLGLSAGLAFNLRLAKALGLPLAATLVNFVVGAALLLTLWLLGLEGNRPSTWPPLWTLLGGLFGATYVTLSLIAASRLGAGISTVAVTFGQVLSAIAVTALGWFGQTPKSPSWTALLSAALLLSAVALLTRDRERSQSLNPSPEP
jgi:transporter family-2 protein